MTRAKKKKEEISLVNAVAFMLGVVLFSYSIFYEDPGEMALQGSKMAASVVGVETAVPPNEYNTLAQQLSAKEGELAEREAIVRANEERLAERDPIALYSFMASIALFILVAINFAMDWRRFRNFKFGTLVVR